MQQNYSIIRSASLREVLEHFIHMEAQRKDYAPRRAEMEQWLSMSDPAFFARVRAFGDERTDTNPLLTWTVGTKNNEHHRRVRGWVFADVPIKSLFTSGLNPSMRHDLDSVGWNLSRFTALAHKYPEFRLDSLPAEGEMSVVVGVAHLLPGKDGTVDLIDGAHRVVAMSHNGVHSVKAFIGELS